VRIWTAWKIWRKAAPLLALVKEARVSKNIILSKIFWANAISLGLELTGALTGLLAPGTLHVVTTVLTIALRLVTSQPVTVLPVSEANNG
jgi:hypothetical protein|tara:strand:- start:9 stop:278 length:270 start_codon:yes stop_codon:yes gene_type:complete